MINITVFNTVDDIMALTGITDRDKLWDVGFNLDDWDMGICSDVPLAEVFVRENEYNGEKWTETYYGPINDSPAYWLMFQMYTYCVGFDGCEYGGKYYYLVHHS